MTTTRKFLIYLILTIIFFIFSQLIISYALHTTYKEKQVEIKTEYVIEAEIKASSIDGYAKGKIKNDSENILQNKYIKVETYSKHDVLMGTKYAKIDNINANEEKEFEIHFNFNKVDKAIITIINEEDVQKTEDFKIEDFTSDPKMGLAAIAAAIIIIHFV